MLSLIVNHLSYFFSYPTFQKSHVTAFFPFDKLGREAQKDDFL